MIHEVKLPRETKLYLAQVVRTQLELLRSGATLQEEFSQDSLCLSLSRTLSVKRAEQLAEWVFDHPTPRQALKQFVEHGSPAEKIQLVEQMRRDVARLYWGQSQETLEYQFPQASSNKPIPLYLDAAYKFLVYFYNSLGSGLSGSLFHWNPQNYNKYGREQFFGAYERENPEQHVCAICDEHRYMTILRGAYFSDIEHYFPKAIFPHLACHPYNLLPICRACNSNHRDKDPLRKSDESRRTFGEIFLPYRAESVDKHAAIKLSWQTADAPENRPRLQIHSLRASDSYFQAKLAVFSDVYGIPGRWQDQIHQIGEQLWRHIRHYMRIEIESGEDVDLLQVGGELEQLLSYLYEDLGKNPRTYGLIWYLAGIIIEEVEAEVQKPVRSEIIPVVDTLREVLKNGNDTEMRHKQRAVEALEAARKMYAPMPLGAVDS